MFRLLRIFAPADGFGKDSPYYEWAEYNLPAATDMAVLQEHNERHAIREESTGYVDAVAVTP